MYKTHLYTGPEDDDWRNKGTNSLQRCFFKWESSWLRYACHGAFSRRLHTQGLEVSGQSAGTVAEYVVALSQGEASLPMNVIGFPADEELAKLRTVYFKLLEQRMREDKGWPVEIVNKTSEQA